MIHFQIFHNEAAVHNHENTYLILFQSFIIVCSHSAPLPFPWSNWDFVWELALYGGVDLFQLGHETPCIKNSKHKSQAKKNGSNFNFCNFSLLAPYTITNIWQSVFVSLFSMVYTPLYPQIFFFVGDYFRVCVCVCVCVCPVAKGQEFLGNLLYQGDLIFFQGEGGQAIFFHKAINNQSCKLKKS